MFLSKQGKKKSLEKDVKSREKMQLLYPLEDWRLREKNRKKKRFRETAVAGAAVLLLYLVSLAVNPGQKEMTQDNRIFRNDWKEGSKTITLTALLQGRARNIEIQVEPRSYSEKELEGLFYEMLPALEQQILGENPSAKEVRERLCFIKSMEGYPFSLEYASSDDTLVRADGSVENSQLSQEGKEVMIHVTASCSTYKRTCHLSFRVLPPVYESGEIQMRKLVESVKRAESADREKESFNLPQQLEGEALQWKEKKENNAILILVGLASLPAVWFAGEQQLRKELESRKRQLVRIYPDFMTRLTLLLGVGMTVRGAMLKMMQEEEKRKRKGVNYLLIELTVFCRALEAGETEGQALLAFGKRSGLQQYKKAAALLTQNLKRGSKNLLSQLEYETHNALEDKKAQARQWGEEAGSKLLIPMIMMLVVVMILIMVPALGSFSL